jgi:hypothetical protein
MLAREPPTDRSAPVVPDDVECFLTEVISQSDDVRSKFIEAIATNARGFVTEVIAALIRCDYPKSSFGEVWNLISPLG